MLRTPDHADERTPVLRNDERQCLDRSKPPSPYGERRGSGCDELIGNIPELDVSLVWWWRLIDDADSDWRRG